MSLVDISFKDPAAFKLIIEILSNIKTEVNAEISIDDSSDSDSDSDHDVDESENKIVEKNGEEKQKGRIKIMTADVNQVILVFITIKNKAFTHFELNGNTEYKLGIATEELNKYMKSIDKDGTLQISYNKRYMRFIVFKNENKKKGIIKNCELRKLNVEDLPNKSIEVTVRVIIRMPSSDFHKACKELQQYADHVNFKCDREKFMLVCPSEESNQERVYYDNKKIDRDDDEDGYSPDVDITFPEDELDSDEESDDEEYEQYESDNVNNNEEAEEEVESDEEVSDNEEAEEEAESDDEEYEYEYEYEDKPTESLTNRVVEATYDIRNFNHFYKCGSAADYVYIHINNQGIAFLSYDIHNLGNILIAVSPSNKGQKQNYDRNMDKHYEGDKKIRIKENV